LATVVNAASTAVAIRKALGRHKEKESVLIIVSCNFNFFQNKTVLPHPK
jgi:hypothetical protein